MVVVPVQGECVWGAEGQRKRDKINSLSVRCWYSH